MKGMAVRTLMAADSVWLPWRGEFGQMLMHHVRRVAAYRASQGYRNVVCCRRGDEALFPTATEFFYDWEQVNDSEKNTALLKSKGHLNYLDALTAELAAKYPGAAVIEPINKVAANSYPNFKPTPVKPWLGFLPVDKPLVVVGPRFRKHGEHRNYQHWAAVVDGLLDAGLEVALVGMLETSCDHPRVRAELKSWNHDSLDTCLAFMNAASLVVTTDCGIAHLAVLNQTNLVVIYDEPGKEAGHPSWPWILPHMQAHAVARCEPVLFGWRDPCKVVSSAKSFLDRRQQCPASTSAAPS